MPAVAAGYGQSSRQSPSATAGVLAAEQAVQQAQGRLLQASDDLRTAQTAPQQVSVIRARADAADAQALQRKAQLAQTELNLSLQSFDLPVTGIIGKKTVVKWARTSVSGRSW